MQRRRRMSRWNRSGLFSSHLLSFTFDHLWHIGTANRQKMTEGHNQKDARPAVNDNPTPTHTHFLFSLKQSKLSVKPSSVERWLVSRRPSGAAGLVSASPQLHSLADGAASLRESSSSKRLHINIRNRAQPQLLRRGATAGYGNVSRPL